MFKIVMVYRLQFILSQPASKIYQTQYTCKKCEQLYILNTLFGLKGYKRYNTHHIHEVLPK